MDDPEIGREIPTSELTQFVHEVVVLHATYRPEYLISWIIAVEKDLAIFNCAEINMVLYLVIKDSKLLDDQGRELKVHVYLGEVV
jgi:hypothetical protein